MSGKGVTIVINDDYSSFESGTGNLRLRGGMDGDSPCPVTRFPSSTFNSSVNGLKRHEVRARLDEPNEGRTSALATVAAG